MSSTERYDAAIVGGGPAGLSAAIWLGRYLHRTVLLDSGEPRNWEARGIHGYLGRPDITPAEMRGLGREQARFYGAELVDAVVTRIERLGEERFRLTFTELRVHENPAQRQELVRGEEGTHVIEARRLLLAFGIRDIWPDIAGLDQLYGETVHHCPDCDGWEARGCRTVVVASGRKAVGMALALATWTRELVVCTNGKAAGIDPANRAKLEALAIPVYEQRVVRMTTAGTQLRQLELADGRRVDCQRLFFAIGHVPADDLAADLGCERDEEGLIVVDHAHHTSVPNVFAAGDIIPGPHLAIRAAAGGTVAALSIHKSLLSEACRLA